MLSIRKQSLWSLLSTKLLQGDIPSIVWLLISFIYNISPTSIGQYKKGLLTEAFRFLSSKICYADKWLGKGFYIFRWWYGRLSYIRPIVFLVVGYYIMMEEYYMREMADKASALDQSEDGAHTSSVVDDTFYLIKKSIRYHQILSLSVLDCYSLIVTGDLHWLGIEPVHIHSIL
mgnify:CR=1 FL=1